MDNFDTMTHLMNAIAWLVGLLVLVLGWIGSRLHNKLDHIGSRLESIEDDINDELINLERRIDRMEQAQEFRTSLNKIVHVNRSSPMPRPPRPSRKTDRGE